MGSNCKVTDPVRQFTFDLTPLIVANNGEHKLEHDGHEVAINICAAAGACGGTSGACVLDPLNLAAPILNTGTFSADMRLDDGDVVLIYNTSVPCVNPEQSISTSILFVCDALAVPGADAALTAPELVEVVNGCNYIYQVPTSLVCPPAVVADCTAYDSATGSFFDLAPLIKKKTSNSFYRVFADDNDGYEFRFNGFFFFFNFVFIYLFLSYFLPLKNSLRKNNIFFDTNHVKAYSWPP